MSSNGDNFRIPNHNENADDRDEDEDDFGEFEGFEGGVERMQAQAAPSPWATFPDLLPVQTSPATPAEEGQASTSRNSAAVSREGWQPPSPVVVPWGNIPGIPLQDEIRPIIQQMPRRLNPPDVSLGTNQAVGGRVTPDNVHDAALAVVMDHLENGIEPRIPVAQIDRLNQQLEEAEQSRALLEEQIDDLRLRNVELEEQVASGQAQIIELNSQLQRIQETLEQRLAEAREMNSAGWRQDLREIQVEIIALKQSQIHGRSDFDSSRHNIEELRSEICQKLQALESNIQQQYAEMEKRLLTKLNEHNHEINATIESVVQKTVNQVSGNLTRIVSEAIQCTNGGDHQNNLLQSIKVELEKHKEQQKRFLEEERQRQLLTVSSALQSALHHLSQAIDNESKARDENRC